LADSIAVPFGVVDQVGPMNNLLEVGPAPPTGKGKIFVGEGGLQCQV